jgi:hypothetical protein
MAGELGYDTGPYVNVATFCDTVLEGKDDVLSIIRIVDRLGVEATGPEAPDELPPGILQTNLVVGLKAGQARGRQTIQIVIEEPDGTRKPSPERAINFSGGDNSGVNMIIPVAIPVTKAGLYWFDVEVNERLVTRVPLLVDYTFTRGPGPRPS